MTKVTGRVDLIARIIELPSRITYVYNLLRHQSQIRKVSLATRKFGESGHRSNTAVRNACGR
jgi:hypothetical protein